MINKQDYNRCIEILSTLNSSSYISNYGKKLLLEIGYILTNSFEEDEKKNESSSNNGYSVDRLLEDNKQLFTENNMLLKSLEKMRVLMEKKIPQLEEKMGEINKELNFLSMT